MAAIASWELKWPLVGRSEELVHVSELLRSGSRAVVLAGQAGVGKTRLATECLERAAAQGFATLRVAGTQGATGLPFGAFASVVPELGPKADLLQVLRQVAQAIGQRGEGKPVAVFVDDAHLLDEASAALTHMLATGGKTRVIVTLRSGEPAPDPIVALWKDGAAERLELAPLTVREISELLAAALGDPVDGATVHLIDKRTQGNALFLREIVLGALESGALRREEGIWRLRGTLVASSRLIEIIEARLGHLAEPIRRALSVLALGEPLEVELLSLANLSIPVAALERRALVRVEKDGRRLRARLPHPLYSEVLRARLSPLLSRELARVLGDALQAQGARRREDTLRLATWRVDGGGVLRPDIMLAAATTARQRYDFPLAERLARAAVESGAGFDADLLLAQVAWLQGRASQALKQLDALAGAAAIDTERALLAMARISVLDWGLKDTDGALRVAEAAEAAIVDIRCRDQITAERARILGRSGRNGAAVAIAVPLLGRVTGGALVSACFAAGTSMCATGQFAAGLEASERGLAAHLRLEGPPLPFGPYLHLAIRCKLLIGAGRLAEAKALGQAEYDRAAREGSIEEQSFFAFELGTAHLVGGQVATAARLAAESAAVFRELRWDLWVRNALMLRAHALALLGRAAAAREVLVELEALGVPSSELLGPEVLQARAWTEVAAGALDAGLRWLGDAVAMAKWSGAHAFESSALHDLARLGHADKAAAPLRDLTRVVEGDLARGQAGHATALASDDAAGLEEASVTFERCGALLVAAEAAADAGVAWRREGQPRRATAAERRSKALAAGCEGARTPALDTAAPARAALTRRELEIARLAAAGLADKAIADRLCISHRTVENKLHAVYEKLGVQGRAHLRRALEAL